jgi:hypothetical protein
MSQLCEKWMRRKVQSGEPHSLILTPYIPIIDVKDDEQQKPFIPKAIVTRITQESLRLG